MKDQHSSQNPNFRGVALIAIAIGAFAIGALAIGRLAIHRVVIDSAKLKSLEIQDLTVTRLRDAEVTVSGALNLPESNIDPKISSTTM
jgi:hypothetical protein